MIVKSNIFDKINDYMSIEMVKQDFKWWNSKIFCSLDSKLWTHRYTTLTYVQAGKENKRN